jgi:1-acyl-sn-glycerol-3-phosphate acyltransferase
MELLACGELLVVEGSCSLHASTALAGQVKDRAVVSQRMKQHVQTEGTTPLLIFPEGTCVNNEYCVMFKRGPFDLGATVCPIAIKYNKVVHGLVGLCLSCNHAPAGH